MSAASRQAVAVAGALALGCAGAPAPEPETPPARPARERAVPTPAPAPAQRSGSDACSVSSAALAHVWARPTCRVSSAAALASSEGAVRLEVRAPVLVSGTQQSLTVVLRNTSAEPLELFFHELCVGAGAAEMFDVELVDARGRSASAVRALDSQRLFGLLGSECDRPYVSVTLAPGGRLTAEIPIRVAAAKQLTQPALPPGPLEPGTYSLNVVAPIVAEPRVAATIDVTVERE